MLRPLLGGTLRRTLGLLCHPQALLVPDLPLFCPGHGGGGAAASTWKHAGTGRRGGLAEAGGAARALAALAQPEPAPAADQEECVPDPCDLQDAAAATSAAAAQDQDLLLPASSAGAAAAGHKLQLLDGKQGRTFSVPLKKDRTRIMYSRLISRCLKGLGPEFALPIFRKMVQSGVEADVASYTMVIKALMDMANLDESAARSSTTTGGGGGGGTTTTSVVMSRESKLEYGNMAIHFLQEMRDKKVAPNILTYKPIMAWLAACGDERRFELLRTWMLEDGVHFDQACKSYEIKLCLRVRSVDKAQALMEAAKAEGAALPASVHAWWMQALASRGRVQELADLLLSPAAEQLVSSAQDPSVGKALYAALHCLGRFGYEGQAVDCLLALLKQAAAGSTAEAPPPGKLAADLIAAYLAGLITSSKDVGEGVAVLRRLEQAITVQPAGDLTLTDAPYNLLIDRACKQGLLPQGFQLLEEMQQRGLDLTASSFSPFLQEYCRQMRIHDALDVVKHMHRIGVHPTDVIYNCLIHASVKAEDMEMAYNLLAEMKQLGIRPTAHTYNPLISGFGRKGLLRRALAVQTEMAADGVEPDAATFSVLLHACSHSKDQKRAAQLLKDMDSRGIRPTKYVLASMVNVLVRSGNLDKAVALVKQVESEGQKLSTEIKSVLLTGMAAAGRFKDALALYDKMKDEHLQPDAYAVGMVLGMLGTAGHLDRMFAILEETAFSPTTPLKAATCPAEHNPAKQQQLSPGGGGGVAAASAAEASKNCVRVLVACIRHNQLDRAVELLKLVRARGIADESVLLDKIFLDISTGGIKDEDGGVGGGSSNNNLDDGFALIEVMRHMNLKPTRLALEALLDGCVATRDATRVAQVVREMEREGLPMNIFSRIRQFHALVAGNDGAGALDALEEIPKAEFRDADVRFFLYKILQSHYEAAAESPDKAGSPATLPAVRARLDELAGGRAVNLLEELV